ATERPEIGLRRLQHPAGLPIAPARGAEHGHTLALRDEGARGVVDHLPVGEQSREVALEILLGADGRGELDVRRPCGERGYFDVVRHEIEPRLDAASLAVVPLPVRMLELCDVVRGGSHARYLQDRSVVSTARARARVAAILSHARRTRARGAGAT